VSKCDNFLTKYVSVICVDPIKVKNVRLNVFSFEARQKNPIKLMTDLLLLHLSNDAKKYTHRRVFSIMSHKSRTEVIAISIIIFHPIVNVYVCERKDMLVY